VCLKQTTSLSAWTSGGRALENNYVERLWRSVKHEDVDLTGYTTLLQLLLG
jgi:putative transposase